MIDIDEIQNFVKKDGIVFLTYGGFLSQALIAGMTEALEKEAKANDLNMGVANNIFTIFIELAQNIMNYSKTREEESNSQNSEGLIVVGKSLENIYYIYGQNIIAKEDKERLEETLLTIKDMNKDEIKKMYRELRRSGRNQHKKGGGIGFYEIAKRCDKMEFDFKKINDDKFYFYLKTEIITN